MGTRKKRERQEPLWYRSELPEAPGHPFYKRLNGVLERGGLRPFLRRALREVLSRETGAAVAGSGSVFPADDDRFFRRDRQRTRHCLAGGRFAHVAAVSADWAGRANAGSRDDFANAAV